jgi:hypothetical protein
LDNSEWEHRNYAVEKYSIQQLIIPFWRNQKIDKANRENVEISLLIETSVVMTEETHMFPEEHNNIMMKKYVNMVLGFDQDDFFDH